MALLKRKRSGLDPMSVVTKFVNACNRHDADGVASCLHPDFDSIQPMYPTRNFRGADQVRRNWQAIFDAEPGFRLTVLRSAAMDDTIWLELHGAGRDAEVAGVFVMGIQGDRIRWARIYSALVEPVPAGEEAAPGPLREVPPYEDGQQGQPASGEVVEEALIAPVLDIDRPSRRRRRGRRGAHEAGETAVAAEAPAVEAEGQAPADEPVVQELIEAEPEPPVVVEGEADAVVVVVETDDTEVAVEVDAESEAEVEVVVVDDAGPPTEAVDMVAVTTDDEPAVDEQPTDDQKRP